VEGRHWRRVKKWDRGKGRQGTLLNFPDAPDAVKSSEMLLSAATYRGSSLAAGVTVLQGSVCSSSPGPGGWERDGGEQRCGTFAWMFVPGLGPLRCIRCGAALASALGSAGAGSSSHN